MATRTRQLADRMLAAVADRVNMNTRLAEGRSSVSGAKARARLNESSELLGILRNVVAAWDAAQE